MKLRSERVRVSACEGSECANEWVCESECECVWVRAVYKEPSSGSARERTKGFAL